MCHDMCVAVRRQHVGPSSLLPLCRSWQTKRSVLGLGGRRHCLMSHLPHPSIIIIIIIIRIAVSVIVKTVTCMKNFNSRVLS